MFQKLIASLHFMTAVTLIVALKNAETEIDKNKERKQQPLQPPPQQQQWPSAREMSARNERTKTKDHYLSNLSLAQNKAAKIAAAKT